MQKLTADQVLAEDALRWSLHNDQCYNCHHVLAEHRDLRWCLFNPQTQFEMYPNYNLRRNLASIRGLIWILKRKDLAEVEAQLTKTIDQLDAEK